MSIARTWGTDAAERALPFPCNRYVDDLDAAYFRGVTVRASPSVVFRWLCQLRVAPYSYDWIDNRGRRSPQTLTPNLEHLEVGQRFMIFRLAHFEDGRSITLSADHAIFGRIAVTYRVTPRGDGV